MKKKHYVFLAVVAALLWIFVFSQKEKQGERRRHLPQKVQAVHKPDHPEKPRKTPERPAGLIAIIIDDMGSDVRQLDGIEALGEPVSVAVLPDQPASRAVAKKAREMGFTVLLHLPMQPREEVAGLGQGALVSGLGPERTREILDGDLESVGRVDGVNNHMGSGLTADREEMTALMRLLKARGLFFIDSRTTAASQAYTAAQEEGVKAATRDVFLDDSNDQGDIEAQMERLERIALRKGRAVAIGHPRPATMAALKEGLPRLKEKGIKFVGVNKMVN